MQIFNIYFLNLYKHCEWSFTVNTLKLKDLKA